MTNDMAAARAAKVATAATRKQGVAKQVEDLLVSDRVDDELKRKLAYVQDELDRGRTDTSLTDRRRDLINEAGRSGTFR